MIFVILESIDKKFMQRKLPISPTSVIVVDKGANKLYTVALWTDEYKKIEKGIGRFGKVLRIFSFEEITSAITNHASLEFYWNGVKKMNVAYDTGIKF